MEEQKIPGVEAFEGALFTERPSARKRERRKAMQLTSGANQALEELGFEATEEGLPRFLGGGWEEAVSAHAGLAQLRDRTQWAEGAIVAMLSSSARRGDSLVKSYAESIGVAYSTVRDWLAVYKRVRDMLPFNREAVMAFAAGLSWTHYRVAHWATSGLPDDKQAGDALMVRLLTRAHDEGWSIARLSEALGGTLYADTEVDEVALESAPGLGDDSYVDDGAAELDEDRTELLRAQVKLLKRRAERLELLLQLILNAERKYGYESLDAEERRREAEEFIDKIRRGEE